MPSSVHHRTDSKQRRRRLQLCIEGAVQGVGFRPFVYRLATELGLYGWINNSSGGVTIELEGENDLLNDFLRRVHRDRPAHSLIYSVRHRFVETVGYNRFTIRKSDGSGDKSALVLPDIATCPDCLKEIFDPKDRRYRYPFTNCTNCGPRYSVVESLPYDRENTTMRIFSMCQQCREEYENPLDRRFHAQANACPVCGPHLELWDNNGNVVIRNNDALLSACNAIREGRIVALKGLGGFQLLVDAANNEAVKRLRRLKARNEKPFALMYPDLESIRKDCNVTDLEIDLLSSRESPIVLLKRKNNLHRSSICSVVAPDNPNLGVMIPYTPLHHLLMADLGSPVVATSGNVADEPICTDNQEALERLGNICDLLLVHNRPIVHHVDDSIVRVIMGQETVLRLARGYAPLPIKLNYDIPPAIAVGGHLKNSVAVSCGNRVTVSQHIGDLGSLRSYETFDKVMTSLSELYNFSPDRIACDKHPDYVSTIYAACSGPKRIEVQHHHAHVLSCMAENELDGPVLGVSWDGSGYGLDGTIWGGEFLKVDGGSFARFAHFRTFPLPGGEKAIREPWRTSMGILYEIFGDNLLSDCKIAALFGLDLKTRDIILKMLARGINSPLTSSAGRLFDAVAAITRLCRTASFEGQAAMKLEFEAEKSNTNRVYRFDLKPEKETIVLDWESLMLGILDDIHNSTGTAEIAGCFHNTLSEMIVAVANRASIRKVVLTGGCFQNRSLTERTVTRLKETGFEPYWHHLVPPNDGGLCLGQLVAASNGYNKGGTDVSGYSR
jgi:hydrogenase maturation protein HypF